MRRCLYATMAFALVTLLTLVKLDGAHHKAISDTPKLINKVYSTLESSLSGVRKYVSGLKAALKNK